MTDLEVSTDWHIETGMVTGTSLTTVICLSPLSLSLLHFSFWASVSPLQSLAQLSYCHVKPNHS